MLPKLMQDNPIILKLVCFFGSVTIFTLLYRKYHSPDYHDAAHRAVMIQTLIGTAERPRHAVKIIEMIQATIAFALVASLFANN